MNMKQEPEMLYLFGGDNLVSKSNIVFVFFHLNRALKTMIHESCFINKV